MNKQNQYAYFYTDNSTTENSQEHYEVIKVKVFNNDIDEAERKARTINDKLKNGKMPGGYSIGQGNKLPFSIPERYDVIDCPDNTKIQPYNNHDKFIINLIEAESNANYIIV